MAEETITKKTPEVKTEAKAPAAVASTTAPSRTATARQLRLGQVQQEDELHELVRALPVEVEISQRTDVNHDDDQSGRSQNSNRKFLISDV